MDYVFCTHDHSDHLDPFAVSGIAGAAPQTQFLTAPAAREKMLSIGVAADQLLTPAIGETIQVGPLQVHAVPHRTATAPSRLPKRFGSPTRSEATGLWALWWT